MELSMADLEIYVNGIADKGVSLFGTPDNKERLNISHFPSA